MAPNAQVSEVEECFELITKIIGSSTRFLIVGVFNIHADWEEPISPSAGGAAGELVQFMLDFD